MTLEQVLQLVTSNMGDTAKAEVMTKYLDTVARNGHATMIGWVSFIAAVTVAIIVCTWIFYSYENK